MQWEIAGLNLLGENADQDIPRLQSRLAELFGSSTNMPEMVLLHGDTNKMKSRAITSQNLVDPSVFLALVRGSVVNSPTDITTSDWMTSLRNVGKT